MPPSGHQGFLPEQAAVIEHRSADSVTHAAPAKPTMTRGTRMTRNEDPLLRPADDLWLDHCRARIKDRLDEEKGELCRRIDAGELEENDPRVQARRRYLEHFVRNPFRHSVLVASWCFLAEAVDQVTSSLVSSRRGDHKSHDHQTAQAYLDLRDR